MNSTSYSRKRRKILSAWIAAIMAISLFPMLPQTEAKAYSGIQSPLTLTSGTYTLDGVTINPTPTAGITISGDVTLNIVGTNTIKGGSQSSRAGRSYAGINVPSGSKLTIQGTGTLNVTGGDAMDGGLGSGGTGPTSGPGYGGGGAGAGIGGNGGDGGLYSPAPSNRPGGYTSPDSGEASGTIIIKGSVRVYATGGNGGDGGGGGGSTGTFYAKGGGGGGYPAAGIGGGGGGGGAGSDYGPGGGGFSGGGAGPAASPGTGGDAGQSKDDVTNGQSYGGGGGYFSDGGSGGSCGYGMGQNGASGGKSGSVTVYPSAVISATNGNHISFTRGANQPVTGIGSGAGYSEPASGSYTKVAAPGAPTVTVTAGNKQNTITWTTPAPNGAAVTKYEISRKTGTGSYVTLSSTYTSLTYTDQNLTNGTQYTYRVRAYNEIGWGGYSAEKAATPRTVPNAPSAPTVSPGNGQNKITWSAPTNNGAAVTNYEVFQNGSSIGTTTSTTMTKTGLSNGTSYSYTVRAYNAAGWGSQSAAASGVPRTVPSAPSAPKVTAGNGSVAISWTAPASNGAAIDNYEVFQNGTSIGTTTSTSLSKTGLSNGTVYTYTVKAHNAAGWSNASSGTNATPRTVPNAPNTPSVSPGNGSVTISWTAPANNGAAITQYEVSRNGTPIATPSTTGYTDTGLSNGTSYSYTVRAYNAAGWGNKSAAASTVPRTVPGAPSAPSVSPGNGSVTISWTAPANNGATIDSYEVFQNSTSIGTTTSLSMTKTGLQNGTEYTYTVKAHNAAGWGNASAGTKATPRTVPNVPGAPSVSPGNGQVAISWAAPAANGAAITNYEVLRNGVSIKTLNALTYTDTGLTNQRENSSFFMLFSSFLHHIIE